MSSRAAYPDTSFLCPLYIVQETSSEVIAHIERMGEPLTVTELVLYELRQTIRFQVWRHERDRTQGYPRKMMEAALSKLEANIEAGALTVTPADWPEVHALAERLSARHTPAAGHRAFDILHVATALHLGAREFLTFDTNQKKLAKAEGLKTSA